MAHPTKEAVMLSQLKPKLQNWVASDQKIKKLGVSLHYYLFRHRLWEKVWALDNKSIFTEIYRNNLWNNEESRSGGGSTLKHTARLRSGLQDLLHNNGIRSVFDAGCGDFNWMKTIRLDGIKYLGGDIVRELVADNNKKYGGGHTSFVEWDATRDKPPIVDLIFCREVLLHLSFHDARSAIINFKKVSRNTCLLRTTLL